MKKYTLVILSFLFIFSKSFGMMPHQTGCHKYYGLTEKSYQKKENKKKYPVYINGKFSGNKEKKWYLPDCCYDEQITEAIYHNGMDLTDYLKNPECLTKMQLCCALICCPLQFCFLKCCPKTLEKIVLHQLELQKAKMEKEKEEEIKK